MFEDVPGKIKIKYLFLVFIGIIELLLTGLPALMIANGFEGAWGLLYIPIIATYIAYSVAIAYVFDEH